MCSSKSVLAKCICKIITGDSYAFERKVNNQLPSTEQYRNHVFSSEWHWDAAKNGIVGEVAEITFNETKITSMQDTINLHHS